MRDLGGVPPGRGHALSPGGPTGPWRRARGLAADAFGVLPAVWRYRGLIGGLVRRELRARTPRALWGRAWLVIHPAVQIFIYTAIFSGVLRAKLPGVEGDRLAYGVFVCAGLITWSYFVQIVSRGQTLFLEHAYLLRAVRFPRAALPLALLTSATIEFVLVAVIFVGVLAFTGRWPGLPLFAALPLLAIQTLLALALGVLGGTLNVFYRDVGQATSIGLQFWFWLTPIVYPVRIVPPELREVLAFNPLYPIITGYQRIVLESRMPDWEACAAVAALAALAAGVAWAAFRALSADVVDEL